MKDEISQNFINLFLNIEEYKEVNSKFSSDYLKTRKKCIISNLDWLYDPNSRKIIHKYFIKQFGNSSGELYFLFMKYFREICTQIFKWKEDVSLKEYENLKKIFEIILEFTENHIHLYNVKLEFSKLEEECENYLSDIFFFSFAVYYKELENISYISRNSKIDYENNEVTLFNHGFMHKASGKYGILIQFYFSKHSIFKYNTIYLKVFPSEIINKIFENEVDYKNLVDLMEFLDWNTISKEFKSEFEKIINTFNLLKESYFINTYNLSVELRDIINKLNEKNISLKVDPKTEYGTNNIIKYLDDKIDIKLDNVNIFIGRNNTGKTYILNTIFNNHKNHNYKNLEKNTYLDKYFYFIPNLRFLDSSDGQYNDLTQEILNLFQSIFILQHQEVFRFNIKNNQENLKKLFPNLDFNINDIDNADIWIIPNFAEIIEFLSLNFKNPDDLIDIDKDFIRETFPLLILLKKVYESWKKVINKLFQDIRIMDPERIGRSAKFKIKVDEIYFETKELENWKEIGSGVQQLLSIIFIIEYLKFGPHIDYIKFFDLFSGSNYAEAFSKSIDKMPSNKYLFIDELEISLHPSLLDNFLDYLLDISDEIQIFITTHSPLILSIKNLPENIDNKIMVYLMRKDDKKGFWNMEVNNNNIIEIYDELFNFNPLQTSIFFLENQYSYFTNSNFKPQQLTMIQELIKNRFKDDGNLEGLLKLGTINEDINDRILQNTYFLSFQPELIDLQDNDNKKQRIEKIILFQLNKLTDSSRIKLRELETNLIKENKYTEKELRKKMSFRRFLYLWNDCWDFSYFKDFILTYNEQQSVKKCEYIKNKLNEIKDLEIIPSKTLILFPENSIPYNAIDSLLKFAKQKKVVIIGGLEHKKLEYVVAELIKLGEKHKNYYNGKVDYNNLNYRKLSNDDIFINQAIIINADKYFSFQIKNIPYYNNAVKKQEGIKPIIKPTFKKFKTILGNIGVFVCKDFLVNYSIIDKWMDINDINIITIPSFSELINPFRYKIGEIVIKPQNRKKTFIFTNIAEYGGSGAYNFSERRKFEPYEYKIFDKFEEGFKVLSIE